MGKGLRGSEPKLGQEQPQEGQVACSRHLRFCEKGAGPSVKPVPARSVCPDGGTCLSGGRDPRPPVVISWSFENWVTVTLTSACEMRRNHVELGAVGNWPSVRSVPAAH